MNTAVTTTTKESQATTQQSTESPAPESTESEQPSVETTEALQAEPTEQETADLWATVDEGLDHDGDAPTETETSTETETETPPAQETTTETPAEQQTETQTQPETETQPETQTRTEPEPEQPVDVDAIWNQREQALVEEHRIDDELADAILDSPKEHLPKLLAKAQARAERMIWENVNEALPEAIQRVLGQQTEQDQARNEFYEAWPQIKAHVDQNPEAERVIERMRDLFLQQPDAKSMTRQEFINQVGAAASAALKIPAQQQTQTQPKTGQPPAKTRETPRTSPAARSASSDSGKRLGAFEQLDSELDESSGKGAVLF